MGRHGRNRAAAGNQSRGKEADHQKDENADGDDVGDVQARFFVMFNGKQIPWVEIRVAVQRIAPFYFMGKLAAAPTVGARRLSEAPAPEVASLY